MDACGCCAGDGCAGGAGAAAWTLIPTAGFEAAATVHIASTPEGPVTGIQVKSVLAGVKVHLIGGADEASELDAKRAIDQGTRLAATI